MSAAAFAVQDYDLAATLSCGQAFRWEQENGWWVGVIGESWVRLRFENNQIYAETAEPVADWQWLKEYLQIEIKLAEILATFPNDEPMQAAVRACHGLRLVRQEYWECLASFICSSSKQIVQIKQIIALLGERFGEPLKVLPGHKPAFSFPDIQRLAAVTEEELRECKMGFRAPYLHKTAQLLVSGEVSLAKKPTLQETRDELLRLPGVGVKVANCALLFGYGFEKAFPVDVWIMKALRQLYFPKRRVKLPKLHHFSETHFGPNSGYAQQYLFHYMRTKQKHET